MAALAAEARLTVKVYYEDTDALGVVYHANYLKYLERARTELIDAAGVSIAEWGRRGCSFAVYEARLRFVSPARLGDVCEVITRPRSGSPYRLVMDQEIQCGERTLVRAEIHVVCLDAGFALREIPAELWPG
jgi:tol-pal system-associated acyl-CoA thioesterase